MNLKRTHFHDKVYTVTVSYRRIDLPIFTSRVGYGNSRGDALEDADRQLSDGIWKRVTVSTPESVVADLRASGSGMRNGHRFPDGSCEVIKVSERVAEVLHI